MYIPEQLRVLWVAANAFLYLVIYLGYAEERPALLSGHVWLLYFAEQVTQLGLAPTITETRSRASEPRGAHTKTPTYVAVL